LLVPGTRRCTYPLFPLSAKKEAKKEIKKEAKREAKINQK